MEGVVNFAIWILVGGHQGQGAYLYAVIVELKDDVLFYRSTGCEKVGRMTKGRP